MRFFSSTRQPKDWGTVSFVSSAIQRSSDCRSLLGVGPYRGKSNGNTGIAEPINAKRPTRRCRGRAKSGAPLSFYVGRLAGQSGFCHARLPLWLSRVTSLRRLRSLRVVLAIQVPRHGPSCLDLVGVLGAHCGPAVHAGSAPIEENPWSLQHALKDLNSRQSLQPTGIADSRAAE